MLRARRRVLSVNGADGADGARDAQNTRGFRTFRAPVDKLSSFGNKLFRNVQEFLDLVRHACDFGVEIERSLERRDWVGLCLVVCASGCESVKSELNYVEIIRG